MKDKTKIVSVALVCMLGVTSTYVALNTNDHKIVAATTNVNTITKVISETETINGHPIKTRQDAINWLGQNGIEITNDDVIDFVAPTIPDVIYQSPSKAQPSGYTSAGIQYKRIPASKDVVVSRAVQTSNPSGWTKIGTHASNVGQQQNFIVFPSDKLLDGDYVDSSNAFVWLKENNKITATILPSDIQNVLTNNIVKQDAAENSAAENVLLSQGFINTNQKNTAVYVDNPDTTSYSVATGADAPKANESEQDYKNRMKQAHKSVTDYVCGPIWTIDGKTFNNKQNFQDYVRPKVTINTAVKIDATSTQITLHKNFSNSAGPKKDFNASSVQYLIGNNQEAKNIRGAMGTLMLSSLIKHNQIANLDLSDPKYKDINDAYGLPRFITDFMFQGEPKYWADQLGIDPTTGKIISNPKVADVDWYLKDFDAALKAFIAIANEIPVQNQPFKTLIAKMQNLFTITDANNHLTTYNNLTDAYHALTSSQRTGFNVKDDKGNVVQTFTTKQLAQDWITAHKQQMFNLQIGGKDIVIDGKTLFTQSEATQYSTSTLYEVNGKYFSTQALAQQEVLKNLKEQGKQELAKLKFLDITQRTNFNTAIANANDAQTINKALSDAQKLSDSQASYNVYAKSDTSFSTPLNTAGVLSSDAGYNDLLNSYISQITITGMLTATVGNNSATSTFTLGTLVKPAVSSQLQIPASVLNAQYTKDDALKELMKYVVVRDIDGNILRVDANGHITKIQHNAPVVSANAINSIQGTQITSLGVNPIYTIENSFGGVKTIQETDNLGGKNLPVWTSVVNQEYRDHGILVNDGHKLHFGTLQEVAYLISTSTDYASYNVTSSSNSGSKSYELEGETGISEQEVIELVANKHQSTQCNAKVSNQINPNIFEKHIASEIIIQHQELVNLYVREKFVAPAIPGRIVYAAPTLTPSAVKTPVVVTPVVKVPVVYVQATTHTLIPSAKNPIIQFDKTITDEKLITGTDIVGINQIVPGTTDWKVNGTPLFNTQLNRWEIPAIQNIPTPSGTKAPVVVPPVVNIPKPSGTKKPLTTTVVAKVLTPSSTKKDNVKPTLTEKKSQNLIPTNNSKANEFESVRGVNNQNINEKIILSTLTLGLISTSIALSYKKKK